MTALGTVTAGDISHANIVYPAGHIIQVKGADNYHAQSFDTDYDVIIEIALTNVLASSHVSIFTSCNIDLGGTSGAEGFETHVYRKATSLGAVGAAISGATRVNATGGSSNSATFTYLDIAPKDLHVQTPYWCIDESPDTGTNYYALVGSAYTQTPEMRHDGNCTILVMEIAQ